MLYMYIGGSEMCSRTSKMCSGICIHVRSLTQGCSGRSRNFERGFQPKALTEEIRTVIT